MDHYSRQIIIDHKLQELRAQGAERARAISGLAQVLMLNGRYGRSRDLCREAVAIARAAGAREPEGHALNTLGMDLAHLGEVEPAIESLELALAIGWEVRNADDIGRAFVNLADTLWMTGDPAGALRRVEEGILAADDLGVRSVYGYYLRMNGMFYAWELGEWSTAERFYREAMARPPNGGGGERYRVAYALHWLVASGAAEAEASWAIAWDLVCHDPSATTTGPPPQLAGIELMLWLDRPAEALTIAADAIARLRDEPSVLLLLVLRMAARAEADLAIAAGTRETRAQARATIGDLIDEAASIRAVLGAPAGRTGERISLESATIAAEASRLADAPSADVWTALRDRWHAWGNPYQAAYAGGRLALAAAEEGAADTAASAVLGAHAIAVQLGAAPMLALLEGIARQLRVTLRDAATARLQGTTDGSRGKRPFGLTAREVEVLRLVAAGRTNRHIGEELFISENTAGVHVSNILGKLGVASRTEAAGVAFQSGLAHLDPPSTERSSRPAIRGRR